MIPGAPISYFTVPGLKGRMACNISAHTIIEKICKTYGVTYPQLVSENRSEFLVFPRHLCMFLLKKKSGLSFSEIGRIFDRRHTAVMWAIKAIENYLITNSDNRRAEILQFY